MSYDDPHVPDQPAPAVVTWFKVYAGFLCLLYLGVAALSSLFLLGDPDDLDMSEVEARVMGVLFLVMGLGLFVVCFLPWSQCRGIFAR